MEVPTFGTTPLSKKSKPPLVELDKVPETPPPRPYYWPFKTEDEWIDAVNKDTERMAGVIENKEVHEGKIPFRLKFPMKAGIAAALMLMAAAYWKMCA
jgi:hypothetical protein